MRGRSSLAVGAASAVLLLAACSSHPAIPLVTSSQSKARMIAIVRSTQALFPDRKWEVDTSPVEEDCTLPNGSAGVTWLMGVTTTERGTLADDIGTVVDYWKAKGVHFETLDTVGPSDPIREIVGYPEGVDSIQFSHTDVKDGITGLAECGTSR